MSVKRISLFLALVLAALLGGCGAKTEDVTITAQFDAEAGLSGAEWIIVSTDRDFSAPLVATRQSKTGVAATYTVTVPAGTKTLYWQPIVHRASRVLAQPAEALIGDDETGLVMLDGAPWMTVETGNNPQSGLRCLVLRTVPGSAYVDGSDFSLIEPDGTVLHGGNLLHVEASDDGLGDAFAPGYYRFHDVGDDYDYTGCTLTVGEAVFLSDEHQPELSCDGVVLVFVNNK